jgi:hypothetical protein
MLRWSLAAAALLAVLVSAFLGPQTGAEPLPKEECDKLKVEHGDLVTIGVREQLNRGAEWGKANLTPDQLQRVARFIALDEQLSFRCGLNQLRITLPVVEEGGEQELDENGQPIPAKKAVDKDVPAKAKADVPPKAKADVPAKIKVKPAPTAADTKRDAGTTSAAPKPKPKAKDWAVSKDAAVSKAPEPGKGQSQGQPSAAKAQVKPKPKPKVDDAYRPPQKNPGTDPFAAQPK